MHSMLMSSSSCKPVQLNVVGGADGMRQAKNQTRTGLQDDMEDELDDSQEQGQSRRRNRGRVGELGDWESIGWMAASLSRRVPGMDFM
jgi:hypothetical protein